MYISLYKLLTVNWYPVKMVVVMCLVLCSKFAKNRLSVGLLDPLGELTALLQTP